MTTIILLGFGIPIFAHVVQFWGKALRATVIFAVKHARAFRRRDALPDRRFVAGTTAIRVEETE